MYSKQWDNMAVCSQHTGTEMLNRCSLYLLMIYTVSQKKHPGHF